MLEIKPHKNFKKNLERDKISGFYIEDDFVTLKYVINELANLKALRKEYKDHNLKGVLKNFRECHIKSDWLLIYKIDVNEGCLYLVGLGTHSQLFNG